MHMLFTHVHLRSTGIHTNVYMMCVVYASTGKSTGSGYVLYRALVIYIFKCFHKQSLALIFLASYMQNARGVNYSWASELPALARSKFLSN